ncbi:uncharacterized protein [Argopecten irradians]|uniref:uncharacterized protein n=1 Tax=Argopecten irradians TaxID=31199 RepID=UPI00371516BA
MENYFEKMRRENKSRLKHETVDNMSRKVSKPKNVHHKITEISLEDETLTLWRPSVDNNQYRLIPETIDQGEWENFRPMYYHKFDCISSILPFDDAIPVIANQATTLVPTHDYSILRDYPRIRGLWYQPEKADIISIDDESRVGNIKFSIFFPRSDHDHLISKLNMYYLEVMDYESDDKSVSRFLLTKNEYPDLPIYDSGKPGGPVFIEKHDTLDGVLETYYFLRICTSYTGRIMEHEVEFMLEEDPWPLCHISSVTHKPFKPPINVLAMNKNLDVETCVKLNTRFQASTWEDTLAGLFAWSLRTHVPWLVYERLHENIKGTVTLTAMTSPLETISIPRRAVVCSRKLDLLIELNAFIIKCQNDKDLQDLKNLFCSLHECDDTCPLVSVRHIDMHHVMPPYLCLLERVIASNFIPLRRDIVTSMLPWPVLAYYFADLKIDSCRKMIAFISQVDGVCQEFPGDFTYPLTSTQDFNCNLTMDYTEKTSGFESLSSVADLDADSDESVERH